MHREGDPRPTWGRRKDPHGIIPTWKSPVLSVAPHWVEPQNNPLPLSARRDQPRGALEAPFHRGISVKWFQELIQGRGTQVSVGLGTHPQLFTAIRLETRTKG